MCFINVIIIADDNILPSKDVQHFCDFVHSSVHWDCTLNVFVRAPVAAQPGLVYQSTDFLQTGTHRSPSECTGYIMNVC